MTNLDKLIEEILPGMNCKCKDKYCHSKDNKYPTALARKLVKQSIPSKLWVARSDDEIADIVKVWWYQEGLENRTCRKLVEALMKYLRGLK